MPILGCQALFARLGRSARSGGPRTAVSFRTEIVGGWRVTAVLQGVRILEVAEHTFVPAASALLSDWGAEVIKIEHVERGDAMRGLASTGLALVPSDVHALLEHSNRGKRSLGLDLTSPEGLGDPLQAGRHGRCLPHQQAPERPAEAQDRRRGDPGPQPRHHLRARHRPGRAGPRRRQGLLRLAGLLGPVGCGHGSQAPRVRPRCRSHPAPGSETPSAP